MVVTSIQSEIIVAIGVESKHIHTNITIFLKIINTLKVSADEALGTDSYIGKINDATELSAKLDKLNPLHRDYASATLKLIVEYFSDLE